MQQQQFDGLFRGMGRLTVEPVCAKRSATTIRGYNELPGFSIGNRREEDNSRFMSNSHASFTDHAVVYGTCDRPDKNASMVEMPHGKIHPSVHYRTEQRERFPHHRDAEVRQTLRRPQPPLVFGDDRPGLMTQTHSTHRHPAEEGGFTRSRPSAGSGDLVQNNLWKKSTRCHPIHSGEPGHCAVVEGINKGHKFGRKCHSTGDIAMHATVRNPIFGHETPLEDYRRTAFGGTSSQHVVHQANSTMPYLRSVGALRPHV